MFNFSNLGSWGSEIIILGLIGLGVYAQSNEINLANNTSILLILFLLFLEQEQIDDLKRELCCNEIEDRRRRGHGRFERFDECGCRRARCC